MASHEAEQGLIEALEAMLIDLELLNPANPKRLMPRLRRFFAKAGLEKEEVAIWRGGHRCGAGRSGWLTVTAALTALARARRGGCRQFTPSPSRGRGATFTLIKPARNYSGGNNSLNNK